MKRIKDLEDLYMRKRIKLFGSDIPYNYKSLLVTLFQTVFFV